MLSSSIFKFRISNQIRRIFFYDVFLMIPYVAVLASFVITCGATCNQADHDSLKSFAIEISTPSPLNWSSFDCCTWEGVGCDHNSRVVRLWLPSKDLSGNISASIVNLTSLSQLSLARNSLSGALPGRFFELLSELQVIDLSFNRLSGEFAESDRLPSSIETVDLSSNHFNGTIQSSLFQQALNLVSLNISNNSFSGLVPAFVCRDSPSIKILDFSFNKFSGIIDQGFGGCLNLVTLRAGFNNLAGPLPDDIYKVSSLEEIFLPGNHLSGTIDEKILNLVNLRFLVLFGNELTGMIPQDIGRLTKLEQLMLHINQLSGTLPPSLTSCTRLTILNLRVNFLQGQLSTIDFSKFVQLNTIDLGNNNFTGILPATLFACRSLTAIRLATNKLEGEVLPDIQALPFLSFLSLSNNTLTNITGALRIMKGCKNITTVILSKNFYNESLPSSEDMIGAEEFQNLQVLGLGGCGFTGLFPAWLSKLGKLEVVDLSYNMITGIIPGWVGSLPNLFYLDLSVNLFNGSFPVELTSLRRLATQEGSEMVQRSYLELPVFIQPNNASYLQYNQLANLPPAIYVQNNSLTGNIPVQIGQLKFIQDLDLSDNNFNGNIPDTISTLYNLELLDLSGNHLSGEIPASLKSLHFLSSFNVANNNLEGPVPTGGQFDTFPNSSFFGNPNLCGPILQRRCNAQQENTYPSVSSRSPKKKIIIGLILGISFGVAFTLIMIAVWLFSKRRIRPGETEKFNADIAPFDSSSALSLDVAKDASQIMLFPNSENQIKDLTIDDILKATDNFNQANIIGCGGFGLVYKAILADGTKLAIKKLSGDMGVMEREFKAEVEALSTAQHKNLVSLQGYCVHDGFRILIYSYMENGSLDYWLHEKADGPSQLDWPTRLKIAQGASCGLAYMHQICEPHIVHRDIKSSNILLNGKFEAHVADFGLSRLMLPYDTHVTTELVGTIGYIPPEYSQAWIATLRGDVYSFGVVMLELLTGKRPLEIFRPKLSKELVVWVQQMRNQGQQDEIFAPLLKGKGFEEEMLQVLDVACMCVNQNPLKRPTIQEVVDWLKDVGSQRQTPKDGQ